MSIPVYTIGYGDRTIDEFLELLQRYAVQFLVDVRSQPYSRYQQDFSREVLEWRLKQRSMRYLFLGDTLGGRPSDSTCYTGGKADYEKIRLKHFYQQGIRHLLSLHEKQLSFALMCSEAKPQECHRGKLIGNTLLEKQVQVVHIDEAGKLKTQQEINEVLTGGQLSLFEEQPL